MLESSLVKYKPRILSSRHHLHLKSKIPESIRSYISKNPLRTRRTKSRIFRSERSIK